VNTHTPPLLFLLFFLLLFLSPFVSVGLHQHLSSFQLAHSHTQAHSHTNVCTHTHICAPLCPCLCVPVCVTCVLCVLCVCCSSAGFVSGTADGLPLLGPIPGVRGAYVAAGDNTAHRGAHSTQHAAHSTQHTAHSTQHAAHRAHRAHTGGGTGRTLCCPSGHGCWGVLTAPSTGEAMCELLLDGNTSCVNLQPFAPSR
jgi:hypothetical protein